MSDDKYYKAIQAEKRFYKEHFGVLAATNQDFINFARYWDENMVVLKWIPGVSGAKGGRFSGILFAEGWQNNKLYNKDFFLSLRDCVPEGRGDMISWMIWKESQ